MTRYFYDPRLERDSIGRYWVRVYKYNWWYRFTKNKYPRPVVCYVYKSYVKALKFAQDFVNSNKMSNQ